MVKILEFHRTGAINCFDGIPAGAASLSIESPLVDAVQLLEDSRLNPAKGGPVWVNGTGPGGMMIVDAPPIRPYQALVKLEVRWIIGEDFLRGGEGGALVQLAAGAAALGALPDQLLLLPLLLLLPRRSPESEPQHSSAFVPFDLRLQLRTLHLPPNRTSHQRQRRRGNGSSTSAAYGRHHPPAVYPQPQSTWRHGGPLRIPSQK